MALLMSAFCLRAQYSGGSNDGYGELVLNQSVCPNPTPNFVFYGGISDGQGDALLIQSVCAENSANMIYAGGGFDGNSDASLVQSVCPSVATDFLYLGGNNDGHGDVVLVQSACPSLAMNFLYLGGNNDGHGDVALVQSACPPVTTNFVYLGGNNDGSGDGVIAQSICGDLTPAFTYRGGTSDGFGWRIVQPFVCTTLLPIELVSFGGTCEGQAVKLFWATASETNNDFFTLEKSADGSDFLSFAQVPGTGNSTQNLYYSYVDAQPIAGTGYYRLKQTDYNGDFAYSDIISVVCGNTHTPDLLVYPNPTSGQLTIEFSESTTHTFTILDSRGQVIHSGVISGKISLSTEAYAPGVYMVRISSGSGNKTRRFVKS